MAHPIDDDRLTHVRSIAVLRANAVGDFLVTLPALGALRATYPQARITLLGQAWHARFLVRRPGPIDEVVVLPPIKGVGASEGSFASEQTTNEFVAH
ncbi:MAG TPA: hypothetical protein VFS42_08620, partial [Burkholderiaceae bacterium]|nr:hypothetical protein [Burkholderiaceae bacterium]